jgi:hypothetical protein
MNNARSKYRDVNTALADGYKPFLPNVPLTVYHFTKRGNGMVSLTNACCYPFTLLQFLRTTRPEVCVRRPTA